MAKNDAKTASRDGQVITLLNTIGERLIRSEAERRNLQDKVDRFGKMINDLDDRSGRSEHMFLKMQNQLTRAEAAEQLMREDQERFQQIFSAQMEKIEKAALLAERIEEAIQQQNRLTRRMEQVSQDKVKMIRKLERIEETVMETQNALNSKALVLLTDQGAAAKTGAPQISAADLNDNLNAGAKLVRAKLRLGRPRLGNAARMAGVAALVILACTAGWAAYRFQNSAITAASAPAASIASNGGGKVQTQFGAAAPKLSEAAPAAQEDITAPSSEEVLPDETAAGDGIDAGESEEQVASADLPDTEGMEPTEELAAQLNDIEPSSSGDALPPVPDASPVAMPATQARYTPPATPAKSAQPEISVPDFLKSQKETAPLATRITPDPSLPPVVKEVEKKAFQGIPEAQHDLAAIYTAGQAGVKVDYVRASQWFKESALAGVANARYNLGVLYHQGLGVKQNIGLAISWYAAAADLGHPEAQYNLGIAHIQGIGTNYDPFKAAEYFEKAARSGIMEAAFNLGLIQENGLLGRPDPAKAVYWYKNAADQGSKEAKAALDQVVKAQGYKPEDIDRIMRDSKVSSSGSVTTPAPIKKSEAAAKTATPPPQPLRTADLDAPVPGGSPSAPLPSAAARQAPASPTSIGKGQSTVSQIQQQLIRLGLYPGPADGIENPMTGDAIRSYQQMNGLDADGRATQALLVHMKTSSLGNAMEGDAVEQGSRDE